MQDVLTTLGIEPSVILANIVGFIILYWVLKKVMLKPISGILQERREEIEGSYQRIADETAKVEQAQAELRKRLDDIETEARARIEEAGAQAARLKEDILAEARIQAEQVKERGLQEIEREREKALQSIREHVANLVAQASGKILEESLTDAKHRALIDRTLDQLETMKN